MCGYTGCLCYDCTISLVLRLILGIVLMLLKLSSLGLSHRMLTGPLKVTKAALNSCNYMSVTEKKTGRRNLELISTRTPTLNDEARYFMLGIKGGLTAFIRPLGH